MVRFNKTEREVRQWRREEGLECRLIWEMFGIPEGMVKQIADKVGRKFDRVKMIGQEPLEFEFKRARAPFDEIKSFSFTVEQAVAAYHDGVTMPLTKAERAIDSGDTREINTLSGSDAYLKALREVEIFLKPGGDVIKLQGMRPRPSVAFELVYDVPRGPRGLSGVKKDIQEAIDEGVMDNIGEMAEGDDGESLLIIPLRTAIKPSDYPITFFDIGSIVDETLENITGEEQSNSPRMKSINVACTEVGGQ